MSASTRVGTAVAAGYVLGRYKKLRMALIVGSALANRNVRAAGMDLIRGQDGGKSSPIVNAGKSAVIAAASSSMNRISDRLHERSAALTGEDDEPSDEDEQPDEDQDYEDEPEDEAEDEPEDEADVEDEDEDFEDEEEDLEDEDEPDEDEDNGGRRSRRRRATAPGRA